MPIKWAHAPTFSTCVRLWITENQFLVAQINLLNQSKSRNEGAVIGLITC